ncbi:MAG TPA: DUF2703 domain-containing protein [Synergistales bacterium]|jgi:hypothetical protein|nr:DUF2703 domain-containing protein [Synergistales bacterium]HRV71752.1 DUF2703 domain-containing protein [Thermovirgaceae bacterium]
MEASTIRIRHYAPEGAACKPVQETFDTIKSLVEQLGPKLEKMGFPVTLESVSSGNDTGKHNMVTMECMGVEFPETPLDEILGFEASVKPCESAAGECRVIVVGDESYQAVPAGLIADGLLRVALSSTGGCGSGCGTCGGG